MHSDFGIEMVHPGASGRWRMALRLMRAFPSHPVPSSPPLCSQPVLMMAAGRILKPVTFVTGNAKKLEEVQAIFGSSIPLKSKKLDCEQAAAPFSVATRQGLPFRSECQLDFV